MRCFWRTTLAAAASWATATTLQAASPSLTDALQLAPTQAGVDYDVPPENVRDQCTIAAEKVGDWSGWVVRDPNGVVLRRFMDASGDGHVNQWSYFKDGAEVYRDIDGDANRRVDECRWLNQGGSRWGVDSDEDGKIERWKRISAEEVSAEIVDAVRDGDAARFKAVLASKEEIQSLQLGAEITKDLLKRVADAEAQFAAAAKNAVDPQAKWASFAAARPGYVPAESVGGRQDLLVYENSLAMLDGAAAGAHLQIGSLVACESGWRAIGLPVGISEADSGGGFFFTASATIAAATSSTPAAPDSDAAQKLLDQFDALEKQGLQGPALHARRAEILESLIVDAKSPSDREAWVRQFADMVSAAVQTGEFPGGVARLERMEKALAANAPTKALAPYVEFRRMMASYIQSQMAEKPDFAKIQDEWVASLKDFIGKHQSSTETAEAMLELATTLELNGEQDEALKWYQRAARDFDGQDAGVKAAGAARRIDSVGKRLTLKGTTYDGKAFDLSQIRGPVVLHYWASWSDLCRADVEKLKQLRTKYGAKGVNFIGVSLDVDRTELARYVKTERVAWPQLFEEGGLDSRLANELGIRTVPTMLLIDARGAVVSNGLHISELDAELAKLVR